MLEFSPKLKELIFSKLNSDLENTVFHPYGRELWILDKSNKIWYFQSDSLGNLWYNQKVFSSFFLLFSLNYSEYQIFLKEWFESTTGVMVRQIARKNTNYEYVIEGVIRRSNSDYEWSLSERHGFSYHVVKHYLDLKQRLKTNEILMNELFVQNCV